MAASGQLHDRHWAVSRVRRQWSQGSQEMPDPESGADAPLVGASAEPKKRPRTLLTDKEVDAMRTARADGVRVATLAKQFRVHRATVWARTRLVGTGDGNA